MVVDGGGVRRRSRLAFVALYVDYVRRSDAWFADLPLSLAALPFTLVMRTLNGGSFAFGGSMTGRVIAAGLFGSALAYLAGLIVETIVRFVVRLVLESARLRVDAGAIFTPGGHNRSINSTAVSPFAIAPLTHMGCIRLIDPICTVHALHLISVSNEILTRWAASL